MRHTKADRTVCVIFLAVIMFFMCSVGLRLFTRQVIVKHFGISNTFTSIVFFDAQNLNRTTTPGVVINWETLYPFATEDESTEITSSQWDSSLSKKINTAITSLKDKIGTYTQDYLIGYHALIGFSKKFEQLIQWNYSTFGEHNPVVRLDADFFTTVTPKTDVTGHAQSTIELNNFCQQYEIPFLYIQAPFKVCKYEDSDLVDFTNENADTFLSYLHKSGINTLDLREAIHQDNLSHHELFFRTDHHWTLDAGLWASQHILQRLHNQYGFNINFSFLNTDCFDRVIYPSWFLGSQGKKTTLALAQPDDFLLLYPNYPTKFHLNIPSLNVDKTGDFSVFYDMTHLEPKDYYNQYTHYTYIYGDNALEQIENCLLHSDERILIIHDSFENFVTPFLATQFKFIDSIDLRHFTGSVQTFIQETKPDIVLVIYNPSMHSEYPHIFDFR